MNTADVGAAIATRFENTTAPTGYTAIQKSTSKRQKGVGKLPMVVVSWEGLRDLEYAFEHRSGVWDFEAIFYYSKAADEEATDAALQAWSDALADRLLGQIQLGEGDSANRVKGAWIRSITPDQGRLGDADLAVLRIAIEVEFMFQDISSLLAV